MRQAHAALQSQKAVTAYFKGKQLLPFGFAWHQARDLSYVAPIIITTELNTSLL